MKLNINDIMKHIISMKIGFDKVKYDELDEYLLFKNKSKTVLKLWISKRFWRLDFSLSLIRSPKICSKNCKSCYNILITFILNISEWVWLLLYIVWDSWSKFLWFKILKQVVYIFWAMNFKIKCCNINIQDCYISFYAIYPSPVLLVISYRV